MPYLETPEELADNIADLLGIYESPPMVGNLDTDHPQDCKCRICFVTEMTDRIIDSVKNKHVVSKKHRCSLQK